MIRYSEDILVIEKTVEKLKALLVLAVNAKGR